MKRKRPDKRGLRRDKPRKATGRNAKPRKRSISDLALQRGLTVLKDRHDLRSAAAAARTSPNRFRREALRRKLIKKRGKGWIVSRNLHREMLIYSDAKQISAVLRLGSARRAGKYMSAVGAFLRSNNIRILDDFIGRGVKDVAGKRHVFETDPNVLYRLASSTDEAFETIYRIVVS